MHAAAYTRPLGSVTPSQAFVALPKLLVVHLATAQKHMRPAYCMPADTYKSLDRNQESFVHKKAGTSGHVGCWSCDSVLGTPRSLTGHLRAMGNASL
jgi:hypothetical protein